MNGVNNNTDINDKNSSMDEKEPIKSSMSAEAKDLYQEDYRSPWHLCAKPTD